MQVQPAVAKPVAKINSCLSINSSHQFFLIEVLEIFWIRNIKNTFFKRNKLSNPFRLVSWCNRGRIWMLGRKWIRPLTAQRGHFPIKHLLIIQKEGPNGLRIYREGDYLLLIQLCGTETPNDKRLIKFMSSPVPGACDRISSCIGAVHQKSQIFVSGINYQELIVFGFLPNQLLAHCRTQNLIPPPLVRKV